MDPTIPTRPCWAEINTRALEDNYRFLQNLAGPAAECLAIVKANAYGHWLAYCAPAAVSAGAHWLGVTSVEEGRTARAICPDSRILVIGGVFPGQADSVVQSRLTPVVWDSVHLDELERRVPALPPASLPVHLEVDTGMSRQGASLDALPDVLARLWRSPAFTLEAVMTHLYASDEANGIATAAQLQQLDDALTIVRSRLSPGVTPPSWLSVGASAALLGGRVAELAALAGKHGLKLMLRLGLALYGLAPRFEPGFESDAVPAELESARVNLKPVLSWKTRIASLRSVKRGTHVGYNGTFIASEPMRLALVPCGYADGLDRRLGNRFSLLVGGQRAPLVGRISMDQSVLDVTGIADVAPDDEVVIIGSQGTESISAYDHADAAGTIPWEVFTRIGPRVARSKASSSQ